MLNKVKLIICFLFFFFLIHSCQQQIDLIVYNAKVYTVDEKDNRASAFAINKGKFIDIGDDEILKRYSANNVIDAKQLPVYPGFIDSHCHFLQLGLIQNQLDLFGTNSFEDVIEKVKDYSKNKNKKIILGRGWDQNDWKINKLPNKEKLDLLFPKIPVVLWRIDGHAMIVNQKALDMAGINNKTKYESGLIVKENNIMTGVLIDSPMNLIERIIPDPDVNEKITALQRAEKIAFSNGLTTVDIAGIKKEDIFLIDSMQQNGLLDIRVYAMISNDKSSVDYFLKNGPIKTDFLNVRSIKVYSDGALGSRGAVLKAEYSDKKNHYGSYITSIDSIQELAYKLAQSQFQMNTHAIGDDAIHSVLSAYKNALVFSKNPRWRIEHAQIIDTTDIKLFNKKIIPSVQPTHLISDMYWLNDRIGPSRMSGSYAYKRLLEKSGSIALGTDFPVESVNPILTFYAAVVRKDINGFPEDGFLPENKLSRNEALKGMTIWAAHANFEEKEKGSIEIGKNADFVILDRDILTISEKRLHSTKIVATIINGKIVYSNRFK